MFIRLATALRFNWTGFYQIIKYVTFECNKATESRPVKLDLRSTVRLPRECSVIRYNIAFFDFERCVDSASPQSNLI